MSRILQILSATTLLRRPAEHGEVLGEDEDGPAVDGALPGDHGIAEGPLVFDSEAGGLMPDELVDLLEGALVEQGVETLPGGQLALLVLACDRPLAPRVQRLLAELSQFLDPRLGAQDSLRNLTLRLAGGRYGYTLLAVASGRGSFDPRPGALRARHHPVVVIAAAQTAGRGRTGAEWITAPRALAVSVATPESILERIVPLSLMAGVAARRALGGTVGSEVAERPGDGERKDRRHPRRAERWGRCHRDGGQSVVARAARGCRRPGRGGPRPRASCSRSEPYGLPSFSAS